MKIVIDTVEHSKQRYPTCGDWQFHPVHGTLVIKVSKLGNETMEWLVAIHELIEALKCKQDGVSEKDVDIFDRLYAGEEEPGDDPDCPYRKQHFLATNIERLLADAFGVDWGVYDAVINSLDYEGET